MKYNWVESIFIIFGVMNIEDWSPLYYSNSCYNYFGISVRI